MIAEGVRDRILAELSGIERNEACRILFAVESGSRAWGFPSRDSDYDVRFIYIRPPQWYLAVDLDLKRDVIERPICDELDISGWDIKKALRLFLKSNPPLLEWLSSPIVYKEEFDFAPRLKALLPTYYSPVSSGHHYLHMVRGNYREYLKGDLVWVKKYLYALRPLLAVRWLEQGRGVVPMEFSRLLVTIEDQTALVDDIRRLVERKMAGDELERAPSISSISDFIAHELERYETYQPPRSVTSQNYEPLNTLFQEM
jgi:predicted nucleotidyltransferase